jgi:hypothetical protein
MAPISRCISVNALAGFGGAVGVSNLKARGSPPVRRPWPDIGTEFAAI